jgi:polynucleotide 5'-kinase involved in rRNA processing
MSEDATSNAADATWEQILDQTKGRTVMVLGAAGTGKTRLAGRLVEDLGDEAGPIGFVAADCGQPVIGVPTCLALSMSGLQDPPAALWFIGDVTPHGSLLPMVLGTARLADRARSDGARTVIIDTTGLAEGPVARALKYHKALAAGVDCVLAVQREQELQETVALLATICPVIHRLPPEPEAVDRSRAERKAYREARYREHFQGGKVRCVDRVCVFGPDWAPGLPPSEDRPVTGTVAGLRRQDGFCLGLGLVKEADASRALLYTACQSLDVVAAVQLGKLRLDRDAEFAEERLPLPAPLSRPVPPGS